MKTRKLIVIAVGFLLAMVAGTAVADDDDGVLIFLFEGELIFSFGHEGLCASAGVAGYTPFQVVDELLSPEDGDVEGTLTIYGNFRPLFRPGVNPGEQLFTGRFHDTGKMVFELDDETIRVPYTGLDANTFDRETGTFLIPPDLGFFTETIVAVDAPGSPVRLFFAAVNEGLSLTGSVVLEFDDDDGD